MMQEDPYARFRKPVAAPVAPAPALPTQPQPFPGAAPMQVRRAPAKELQDQITVNRDIRDERQDARAEEAAEIARLRAQIDADKAERDKATAAANLGVDTTAQNETMAGHAISLQTNLAIIRDQLKADPSAEKPGLIEATLGTALPEQLRGAVASSARNTVRQSYGPILESMVYMATGAAANAEQVERLAAAVVPVTTDGPTELKAKAIRMQAEIAKARSMAGPANLKVQAALSDLEAMFPDIYGGIQAADVANPFSKESPGRTELSGESRATPIPEEMQAEYNAWLSQRPPGTLKVDEYLRFYEDLAKRYEFGLPQSSIEAAKAYVDSYNTGRAGKTIPDPSEPLTGVSKAIAGVAADEGLLGDAYTGVMNAANAFSFGIPELAAGREGREALNIAREANPGSALAGEVIGSLAPSGLAVKGARRVLTPVVGNPLTREVASEVAGNAAYGAVRGYTGAEPEDRNMAALTEGAIGGLAPLAGRAAIKGARGFMDENATRALDSLGPQEFSIPAQRGALPADEITPPAYQGMSDDQLRAEVARAQRGIDAWDATAKSAGDNAAAREALTKEANQVAALNRNRQEAYVKENFRSTSPGSIDSIRADAEQMFPTDPEAVLRLPEFTERAAKIKDFSTKGLEPREVLEARKQRIGDYLLQDPTPRSGTVPGVDLTTAQRAGMGEAEETISGLPGIHGARQKAVESFNRQNSGRVLARIGEKLPDDVRPGTDMNAYVNGKLNEAYNNLRPSVTGKVDKSFNNALAALRKESTKTPERAALWQEIENTLAKFRKPDGSFDGEGYKEVSTTLRRYSEVWGSNQNPNTTVAMQDMARTAEQARRQVQALVGRANPAAGRRLKTIEGAWAQQARIEAASLGAAKGSRGVYSPDEYLNAIQKLDTSKGKTAVARGRGFDQEYAQNAREIMGSKPGKQVSLQNSALTGYLLSNLGIPGLAVATGLGAGYAPGVKRILQVMVEGKLGKTPKAVETTLGKTPAGRAILKATSGDARQKLLTQMLRAQGAEALEE
jgi:hypothetical protein